MKYFDLYIEGIENNFFTYADTEGKYKIGEQVIVDFAKKRKKGIIIRENFETKYEFKVNNIKEKLPNSIMFTEKQVELFLWIKDYYIAKFGDIVQAACPKGLKSEFTEKCVMNKMYIAQNEEQIKFLEYMKAKKKIALSTLERHFSKDLLDFLFKEKIIKVIKEPKRKNEKRKKNIITQKSEKKEPINLTKNQNEIKNKLIDNPRKFTLIRGVTGSGKTEIYIEVIKKAASRGQGSIFMVPEISLTPQMINRFVREFGTKIAILHSRLTDAQRAQEWKSVYDGEKNIVVGVRSAVFAPVKNLKYIIIDEEHETTYKQDSNPRYHAKYVAIKRAELENANVILASATPSVESYFYAKQGIFDYFELTQRYNETKMPEVKVVDMKNQKNEFFSIELLRNIADKLKRKEQILLLLNQKGYSSYIQCKDCGHIEQCENCSVSYNYYKFEGKLKCSYCGQEKVFLGKCSKCSSRDLKYHGQGTEKLEVELEQIFPEARILRIDSETVKNRDAYEKMYHNFLDEKYDILLGTQIIAKGLHFPKITLAAIISADTILNFPDFRAAEKTFQLIVQTAGRSGRGEKTGKVIIQTYTPDHYVIKRAILADYEGFYQDEIDCRKDLSYPPYGKIINIIISSEDETVLYEAANKFYTDIYNEDEIDEEKLEIYGPFQAPIYKIKKRYRYQIFIKGKRKEINEFKEKLKKTSIEFSEKEIRITIDIDPINLM